MVLASSLPNDPCYLYPNRKIVVISNIILSVEAIQGTGTRSGLLESSQPLHVHLLAFYLRLDDGRQATSPEEVVADHAEDLGMSYFRVPSLVQELPGYIVLLLPDADLGHEGLPFFSWQIEFFTKAYSILPNIFEQQLPHILCHVLSGDLWLSRLSFLGGERPLVG